MLVAITAVLVGVVILAVAADQFVIGAARVAVERRVTPLIIGVVIVGFGTSAPELIVSALAAGRGQADVAVGNVLGSNIANLSLLLGIGAALVPLKVSSKTVRKEALLVTAAVAAFGLAIQGGGINRWEGTALLLGLAAALLTITKSNDQDQLGVDAVELGSSDHRLSVEVARTVAGLAGTVGSAQLLLWGALDLASQAGLSEGFVGATLVAIGTSLPELVTVVQSARRGETDLIVGNLLGSNLFNALGVGAVIGLVGGGSVTSGPLTGIAVVASITVAIFAVVAMRTHYTVTRREGIALVLAYIVLVPFLS